VARRVDFLLSNPEKLAPGNSPRMIRAYGKKTAQALGNAKRQEGTTSGKGFHPDDTLEYFPLRRIQEC
jgi:hypothetical protein